jgi:hypothetical protein
MHMQFTMLLNQKTRQLQKEHDLVKQLSAELERLKVGGEAAEEAWQQTICNLPQSVCFMSIGGFKRIHEALIQVVTEFKQPKYVNMALHGLVRGQRNTQEHY